MYKKSDITIIQKEVTVKTQKYNIISINYSNERKNNCYE